ncbi:MAG: phosphopyruvate hydratase [Patescibacteria group bacterium]|nr:MAG: phosphopyruvate hydratase [Patescibacteria group bacterium]
MKILSIKAREILDSRGYPTVEAEVILENGLKAKASVPSGASTGTYEALELRDGRLERFAGRGILKAIKNLEGPIAQALAGMSVFEQENLDQAMLELDGTDNKEKLGANAILAVSLACARAASLARQQPLYLYLSELAGQRVKREVEIIPLMNVLNGGAHAGWTTDIQEYMLVPKGAKTFAEKLRSGVEIYYALKEIIKENGYGTNLGDEGGFAPEVKDNEEPFKMILSAIEKAGYKAGEEVSLAIDAAASEWHRNGQYHLNKQGIMDAGRLMDWYGDLIKKYPLISLEDPFGEDDWSAWTEFMEKVKDKVMVVGDDLYVTNVSRIERGLQAKATSAVLIKPNQIGTVTETLKAIALARQSGQKIVISHRSGETNDDYIADLAVAVQADYLKAGAPARGERVAKYNRLMEIEEELAE